MPLLKLHTSVAIPTEKKETLAQSLSQVTAQSIGKPETYVMVTIEEGTVCISGKIGPGAFVDLRSIGGLNGTVNKTISEQVCALLNRELQIPGDRIYLNFSDVKAVNWGWNGSTFG